MKRAIVAVFLVALLLVTACQVLAHGGDIPLGGVCFGDESCRPPYKCLHKRLFPNVAGYRCSLPPVPSDNLLNFLSVFNGDFSNQRQTELNNVTGEHHPPMFAASIPVEVPAFYPSITFFVEEDVNGAVNRLQMIVISEEDGGIIRLQKYNLPGEYIPGTFDLNQLNYLELSDLYTDAACDVLYEAVTPTIFFGTWPNCHGKKENNPPPNYVALTTCTALAWQSPQGALETTVRLPNDFQRVKKYALLPYMLGERQDYVDPCDN